MALLGSILVDKEMMATVREIVQPADFYASLHETIYLALLDLHGRGEPLDKVALAEELRKRGMLDKIGGLAYVNSLMSTVPSAASAVYYANIVREKSTLREMIYTGGEITDLGYDGEGNVSAALDKAEQLVRKVSERRIETGEGWSGRTAAELSAEGVGPIEFEIEGLLTRDDGPLLWYGPPSAGKSWLALHLTICAVTGERFAGRFHVPKPRPFGLYFNFDAGERAINRRVVDVLHCAHPNVRIFSPKDGWSLSRFERVLAQYPGAFFAIDCLADIYRPDPKQEQGEVARDFFRELRSVTERHDANGVITDHTNRSGTFYGSNQKLGTARQMWSVEVPEGPPAARQIRARVTCVKQAEAEKFLPFDVTLDFDDGGLTIAVAGGAVETARDRLLARIDASGPLTKTGAGANGGNLTRGPRADWKALVDAGLIQRTGEKQGGSELWWTPERIMERVREGASLHPRFNARPEERDNDGDRDGVQPLHPTAPNAPTGAPAPASAESGAPPVPTREGAIVAPIEHPIVCTPSLATVADRSFVATVLGIGDDRAAEDALLAELVEE